METQTLQPEPVTTETKLDPKTSPSQYNTENMLDTKDSRPESEDLSYYPLPGSMAVLGLRKAFAERRSKRLAQKLAELEDSSVVVDSGIARQASSVGYSKDSIPITKTETRATKEAEKVASKRRHSLVERNHLRDSYKIDEQTGLSRLRDTRVPKSEMRQIKKGERRYAKLNHHVHQAESRLGPSSKKFIPNELYSQADLEVSDFRLRNHKFASEVERKAEVARNTWLRERLSKTLEPPIKSELAEKFSRKVTKAQNQHIRVRNNFLRLEENQAAIQAQKEFKKDVRQKSKKAKKRERIVRQARNRRGVL